MTGANDFFVLTRERARALELEAWCRPAITDAREIMDGNGVVRDTPSRKLLLALPRDLDRRKHPAVDRYLRWGETGSGGQPALSERYIPRHRRPWWWLGEQQPAPIVASYMARRPPVFALNPEGLALLNIGHGLYPIRPLDPDALERLCRALNDQRDSYRGLGRTYQGGLEKFEPKEMEALPLLRLVLE